MIDRVTAIAFLSFQYPKANFFSTVDSRNRKRGIANPVELLAQMRFIQYDQEV
jgi:hypothetical protein